MTIQSTLFSPFSAHFYHKNNFLHFARNKFNLIVNLYMVSYLFKIMSCIYIGENELQLLDQTNH